MAHDFALLILFGHISKFKQKTVDILCTYTYIHIGDPRKYLMCVITFKAIHTSKKCSSSPSHATSVSSENKLQSH